VAGLPHGARRTVQYGQIQPQSVGAIRWSENADFAQRRCRQDLESVSRGFARWLEHMTCGFAADPEDADTLCVAYTDGSVYATHDGGIAGASLNYSEQALWRASDGRCVVINFGHFLPMPST